MEPRNTRSDPRHGPHATASTARSAVAWVAWTIALALVIAVGLVVVPAVVVWCLLFDAD